MTKIRQFSFVTLVGGAPEGEFAVVTALSGTQDDALTATYEGGAAGRYVTRKLRIKDQGVDPQSPGFHGRFTATATLTANFGMHDDFAAVVEDLDNGVEAQDATHNTVQGTITDFRDGTKDLGFTVTLMRQNIESTGEIMPGSVMAKFSETATSTAADGVGGWSGQFYGPAAVVDPDDEMEDEDPATILPTGVAGKFNANSTSAYTHVVGAFAAEKQ